MSCYFSIRPHGLLTKHCQRTGIGMATGKGERRERERLWQVAFGWPCLSPNSEMHVHSEDALPCRLAGPPFWFATSVQQGCLEAYAYLSSLLDSQRLRAPRQGWLVCHYCHWQATISFGELVRGHAFSGNCMITFSNSYPRVELTLLL